MNRFRIPDIDNHESRMKFAYQVTMTLAVLGLMINILTSLLASSNLLLLISPSLIFVLTSLFGVLFLAGSGFGLGDSRHKRRERSTQNLIIALVLILITGALGIINVDAIFDIRDYGYLQQKGVITQAEVIALHQRKMKGQTTRSLKIKF